MKTVKIYNAADNFETDRVVQLLKEHGMACYIIESGTGSYLMIQQGFNIYGKDIYVDKEYEEKAKSLINEFKKECSIEYINDEKLCEDEGDDVDDAEYKVSWFRNRVIVARIIIVGAILVGVLTFIGNIIQR